ncbi:Tom37 metaxin N-terminal-like domain-containing protein [Nannocystaceae bacterium ST9]
MASTLTLHGFGSYDDQLDVSPFVWKLEAWLRLAELPHRKQLGDVLKAPRGKLPFIELEGRRIADSQDVIDHLQREGLADLDGWLTPRQRATATALRSMIEEDLYFFVLHSRWVRAEAWAEYRVVLRELMVRSGMPGLIARVIPSLARRDVIKALHGQGAGRRPPERLIERAEAQLDALVELAEPGASWLLGERPCTLDAVAHAFLGGMLWARVPTPGRAMVEARPQLLDWYARADAVIRARGPIADPERADPRKKS